MINNNTLNKLTVHSTKYNLIVRVSNCGSGYDYEKIIANLVREIICDFN